jgi:hypothetical protein
LNGGIILRCYCKPIVKGVVDMTYMQIGSFTSTPRNDIKINGGMIRVYVIASQFVNGIVDMTYLQIRSFPSTPRNDIKVSGEIILRCYCKPIVKRVCNDPNPIFLLETTNYH